MNNKKTKQKAFLDVSISVCPHCGTVYADASWYVTKMASDVECGACGKIWNPKASKVERILLEFFLDEDGKVLEVKRKNLS